MLKELYIKNIAVIDELRLDFSKGFHIFTGETGAGKSILVESIGLVLGEKAKAPLIRDGAREAVVEAIFEMTDFPDVKAVLQRESLSPPDDESEIIIRRHIQSDGKNKIFINHQRGSLALLQEIAALLIDYTGQHQQIDLLDARNDIDILDSFLTEPELMAAYRQSYEAAKKRAAAVLELSRALLEKNERLDWIRHQLKELEQLKVETPEAELALKATRGRLKNMTLVREFAVLAAGTLTDGGSSCVGALEELIREVEKKTELADFFAAALKSLKEVKLGLEDAAYEIAKIATKNLSSEGALGIDEIEQRLFTLEKLKRKFGPEITDVLAKQDELLREQDRLENSEQKLAELEAEFAKEFGTLKGLAQKLSILRHDIAGRVEQAVLKELGDLQMAFARFTIEVRPSLKADDFASYGGRGYDAVRFLLSPNPGLSAKPLAKIASGGETSRIFLAIKQVLTRYRKSGTLIFDEIDTGISGAAVELTGKKLKDLAGRFQVFCITHHAQIASLADRHFLVSKEVTKGHTFTRVKVLSQDEQIKEVARLMGGIKISAKNLEYAREMVVKRKS